MAGVYHQPAKKLPHTDSGPLAESGTMRTNFAVLMVTCERSSKTDEAKAVEAMQNKSGSSKAMGISYNWKTA